MGATFAKQVTVEMIVARMLEIQHVTSSWTGSMPRDAEEYDQKIIESWSALSIDRVQCQFGHNEYLGDSAADELDMAIADAIGSLCDLPENCCVEVYYAA